MTKIILTRIDDRLIHGQVVTAWMKYYPTNHIVIVDDVLSKNMIMQRLYKAAAPSGIDLNIYTVHEGVQFLKEDHQKNVMLLVKNPLVLEALIDEDVKIESVVLGGMGSNPERTQFIKNVFASDPERTSFKRIMDKGIPINYQLVPDDRAINIENLL